MCIFSSRLMKRNISVQLKVAFLFIIFSLNMIVAFSCAPGTSGWFNTKYHEKIEIIASQSAIFLSTLIFPIYNIDVLHTSNHL